MVAVFLVLAIGLLVVGFFTVGKVAALAHRIYEWIAEVLGLELRTELEEAVMCSYYRCELGCDDPKVIGLLDGECKKRFCDAVPGDFKQDGSICNFNAAQWPVEIGAFKSDKLFSPKRFEPEFDCVIPMDVVAGGIRWGEIMKKGVLCIFAFPPIACPLVVWLSEIKATSYNILVVNHTILESRETVVRCKAPKSEGALGSFMVRSTEELFLYTVKRPRMLSWAPQWETYVDTVYPYRTIGLGTRSMNFTDPGLEPLKYRVRVGEEDYVFSADVISSTWCDPEQWECNCVGPWNVSLSINRVGEEPQFLELEEGETGELLGFVVKLTKFEKRCFAVEACGRVELEITREKEYPGPGDLKGPS
jgi:hypothetical protein